MAVGYSGSLFWIYPEIWSDRKVLRYEKGEDMGAEFNIEEELKKLPGKPGV